MIHKKLQQEKYREHNIGRIVDGVLTEPKLTREETLYNAKKQLEHDMKYSVSHYYPIEYIREVSDLYDYFIMEHYREKQSNKQKGN